MKSFDSKRIKSIVFDHGADLCGIAPQDRFIEAPKGFSPTDIYEKCKSVIVFAKRLPIESAYSQNCIPYTFINHMITEKVDNLTFDLCLYFQELGIGAIPIPSDDPYEYWIPEKFYGRAILSLRHAGFLAGLGVLGKNTLLMNQKYGNMIQLGAILTNLELEGDSPAIYDGCTQECNICIESCPVSALDGVTVDQRLCRPLSNVRTTKGYILKKCNICRISCPNYSGINR
jgi:epoxyqueuosine reductase